jgi:hypothetical protein
MSGKPDYQPSHQLMGTSHLKYSVLMMGMMTTLCIDCAG